MSRPEPEILLEQDTGEMIWQLTQCDQLYIITYRGGPIGIRTRRDSLTGPGYKYKKLSYPNQGNAAAQAHKLNQIFDTDLFSVYCVQVDNQSAKKE